mmetsp:Transcript_36103/g.76995  ORF Transcript_36103/g.76995 Transcript_36103/m.76995 type:complete len:411 (-) Transcript_36103:426-1658(-)
MQYSPFTLQTETRVSSRTSSTRRTLHRTGNSLRVRDRRSRRRRRTVLLGNDPPLSRHGRGRGHFPNRLPLLQMHGGGISTPVEDDPVGVTRRRRAEQQTVRAAASTPGGVHRAGDDPRRGPGGDADDAVLPEAVHRPRLRPRVVGHERRWQDGPISEGEEHSVAFVGGVAVDFHIWLQPRSRSTHGDDGRPDRGLPRTKVPSIHLQRWRGRNIVGILGGNARLRRSRGNPHRLHEHTFGRSDIRPGDDEQGNGRLQVCSEELERRHGCLLCRHGVHPGRLGTRLGSGWTFHLWRQGRGGGSHRARNGVGVVDLRCGWGNRRDHVSQDTELPAVCDMAIQIIAVGQWGKVRSYRKENIGGTGHWGAERAVSPDHVLGGGLPAVRRRWPVHPLFRDSSRDSFRDDCTCEGES